MNGDWRTRWKKEADEKPRGDVLGAFELADGSYFYMVVRWYAQERLWCDPVTENEVDEPPMYWAAIFKPRPA